jgi:hypothetical protein
MVADPASHRQHCLSSRAVARERERVFRQHELIATPWSTPERPLYISGPNDDAHAIFKQLESVPGSGGHHFMHALTGLEEPEDGEADGPLVYSPLRRAVIDDDASVEICIYRAHHETQWSLEIEDASHGFAPEVEALWVSMLGTLADEAADGEQKVFAGGEHYLQLQHPEDVAEAVVELVASRRTRASATPP